MSIENAIKTTKKLSLTEKTVINMLYTSRFIENTIASARDSGITMPQYNVLRILRGQKGQPANLSTIQERMIDKSSNTTRLVDKLIKKELAQRQTCPTNRRKVEITITTQGLQLLEEMDPAIKQANKEILKNLNDTELQTLNTLLDKLRNDE